MTLNHWSSPHQDLNPRKFFIVGGDGQPQLVFTLPVLSLSRWLVNGRFFGRVTQAFIDGGFIQGVGREARPPKSRVIG
jgi:hypothetical protein